MPTENAQLCVGSAPCRVAYAGARLMTEVPHGVRRQHRLHSCSCRRAARYAENRSHLAEVLTGPHRLQRLLTTVGKHAYEINAARLDDIHKLTAAALLEQHVTLSERHLVRCLHTGVESRRELDHAIGEGDHPVVMRRH